MRESAFIKKNLARWQQYQQEPSDDPDVMAERFTSLLDDLAYAKTFYSFSKVTHYINGMAAAIYQHIYRNRREDAGRVRRFAQYELPLLIRRHHRLLLFTFCYFLLFCIIGAFSAAHDESFVRGVLGDEYVNMTEQNISNGDPFGVYKSGNEWVMFLTIAYNNINVAFMCFVGGIMYCAGTLWLLFTNGIMLGSFQYYFFAKGLGWQSVLVIWIHGTLEISAIVIAGTAGMIMGSGLLFPGTRKRVDSLKRAAKDGVKVIVSLVPVFIAAAFLEGFITRHTAMPMWLSISILLLSLTFIIGYFVIYPVYLQRKGYRLTIDGTLIKPAA
jgi:uncharacterized membrane protein SpoIIM required for sporulation